MQRLDRFLSEAGVASRRELRTIIRAGRVRVNDVPASAPEQKIDEKSLTTQTAKQRESLQQSSQKGVEAFMLSAYRRMPSPELGEYVALYQQPAVKKLLDATLKALPEVFAAQRQQHK